MRSLFVIATCIAGAIALIVTVFPWAIWPLTQSVAVIMILALIGYAGAEAWPHLHRYLQKRGIAE